MIDFTQKSKCFFSIILDSFTENNNALRDKKVTIN